MIDEEKLSAQEATSVVTGLQEIEENRLYFAHSSLEWAKITLNRIWQSRTLASRFKYFLFSIRIALYRLLPIRRTGRVTRKMKQRAAERNGMCQ